MKKSAIMLAGLLLSAPLYAADISTDAATGASATDTTATPSATSSSTAATPAKAMAKGEVARSAFTTSVDNREPVDNINSLENNQTKIYYFTELRNMQGQTVKHRWEYKGKIMAEVPFQINGSRWRTYSSKKLDPSWNGEWKASVVDEAGNTLSVNTFTYSKAEASAAAATPAASSDSTTTGTTGSTTPTN
ncbi:MAG: hypothetical protein BMS9Abin11_0627 [Gammaproteobacteria bacterium]|nr:MAG: hypothetical protein BMS9Abin11_0627 [Gammaproteobacteria bacterium]